MLKLSEIMENSVTACNISGSRHEAKVIENIEVGNDFQVKVDNVDNDLGSDMNETVSDNSKIRMVRPGLQTVSDADKGDCV